MNVNVWFGSFKVVCVFFRNLLINGVKVVVLVIWKGFVILFFVYIKIIICKVDMGYYMNVLG